MTFDEWLEEHQYTAEDGPHIFRSLYDLTIDLEHKNVLLEEELDELEWQIENPDWDSLLIANLVARKCLEDAYLKTNDPTIKQDLSRFFELMGFVKPFETKGAA